MIKFGPSGNGEAFYASGKSTSIEASEYVKSLGLNCFEYSFGRGVTLSEKTAVEIGEAFKKNQIELSIHAPYFINFASVEEEKVNNSYGYVLKSLKYAKLMGAKRVVFHPSTQGKLSREEAVNLTTERLKRLAVLIDENGYSDMLVCPETMGKFAQIGTVEEIAEFCTIAPFYIPAIDFGHVNARGKGCLKTVEDFLNVLTITKNVVGKQKLDKLHIHFSKIMYGDKGEIKHLTFLDDEYGPNFKPFLTAIKKEGINPYIICESAGTQDVDAKTMCDYYKTL